MTGLLDSDREALESHLLSANVSSRIFLEDPTEDNFTILEGDYESLKDVISLCNKDIVEDDKYAEYKILLIVPFQIVEMVRKRMDKD